MTTLASAVYEGRVMHRRHMPHAHAFTYRMAQLYLDLDELDKVFAGRWLWSIGRRNLAEWRRSDYMGPAELPLAEVIRQRIRLETGSMPGGPIRMLSHLRYVGYVFNPVTFYYCYAADGCTLETIVAEITNTPWHERHAYVLPVAAAQVQGNALSWCFDKQFHVSPFMSMAHRYDWRFSVPADDLRVHMKVYRDCACEFDATLALRKMPLDRRSLARVLWRYPCMTAQVIGAIHWQALRLWLKRNPIYDHPAPHTAPAITDTTTIRKAP